MKTSNKFTLTAIISIIAAMVYYDLVLKAAYLEGGYKKPFKDFITLNYKDFNSINLSASTAANIIVEQGPFSVRIEANSTRFVKVSQNNGTLHIDAAFPGSYEDSREAYLVVISCPKLVKFDTDARYMTGNIQVTDTVASVNFRWRPTVIRRFTLDSLSITEQHGSFIILTGNNIKNLSAVIGLGDGSASNLIVSKDNRFENASFNLLNNSRLQLHEAIIPNLKYQLADSSEFIVTGAAQNLIKK